MNFRDVKKIIVIKLRHIGDVLLAVPDGPIEEALVYLLAFFLVA